MLTVAWCCVNKQISVACLLVNKLNRPGMKKYLCTFYLPALLEEDFWAVIPAHRQHIQDMMRDEVIITYSVNGARSKGWVVLNAESEPDAVALIDLFPIRPFINYELDELFIFDTMIGAPKLVMN